MTVVDLAQQSGRDVEDEAAQRGGLGDERTVLDAVERLTDVLVDVGERLRGPLRFLADLVLDIALEVVVGEGQHAAVGVMDQHDLGGAEQSLADGQRADLVGGDHAAGVADDVGLAFLDAENAVDVQACIHAGDDGYVLARRQRQGTGEGLGVFGVVGQVLVGDSHAPTVMGQNPGCEVLTWAE